MRFTLYRSARVEERREHEHAFREELDEISRWARDRLAALHAVRVTSTFFVARNVFREPSMRDARAVFCKATMFLFAMDEFFDAEDTDAELVDVVASVFRDNHLARLNDVREPTQREALRSARAVLDELIELASNLEGRDMSARVLALARENNIAQTMEFERRWSRSPMSLGDYLGYARTSIGVGFILGLTFSALKRRRSPPDDAPEVRRLLDLGGEVMRVLNDIGTYEKELAEGKQNSVGVIMQSRGLDEQRAMELLLRELVIPGMAKLQAHFDVPRAYRAAVFDLCRTAAWFYQDNDFHRYAADISCASTIVWPAPGSEGGAGSSPSW